MTDERVEQFAQQTEVAKYLEAMFRELERVRPAAGWALVSHGIVWDHRRERLVLSVNRGDCVTLYDLRRDDLADDPVATGAKLAATVEARILQDLPEDDDRTFTFK